MDIEDSQAISFMETEYSNLRQGIQKSKNHLHLMLGLSLTIGGITFSFLTNGLNKDVSEDHIPYLQIGFFASTAIQWFIALNYQGHFRDLFLQSLYVKSISKRLRKHVKSKSLRKSFLRWEEFAIKNNTKGKNRVLVIITWGVPIMIPALMGYLSMVIGDRLLEKQNWTGDVYFSYYFDWVLASLLVVSSILVGYDALTKWK